MRRLMKQEGLKARVRRRYKCTTMSDHNQPVAANLLARQFDAKRPNCRGPRSLTTREAAKLAIVGAAKVSTAGAAKLTM